MATENVKINNLCDWPLYFNRINGVGTVELPANVKGYALLSYDEILAQIQVGNRMFTGTDGIGGHARIQIVDEEQRKSLFGIETKAPVLVDVDSVKELLAIKSKAKFKERLEDMVKTDAEKRMLVELANKAGAETAESWKVDALREVAASLGE